MLGTPPYSFMCAFLAAPPVIVGRVCSRAHTPIFAQRDLTVLSGHSSAPQIPHHPSRNASSIHHPYPFHEFINQQKQHGQKGHINRERMNGFATYWYFHHCIVPRCSVTFWTHPEIIPVVQFSRKCALNQSIKRGLSWWTFRLIDWLTKS